MGSGTPLGIGKLHLINQLNDLLPKTGFAIILEVLSYNATIIIFLFIEAPVKECCGFSETPKTTKVFANFVIIVHLWYL